LCLVLAFALLIPGCGQARKFGRELDCGFFSISYPDSFVAATNGTKFSLKGDFQLEIETLRFASFGQSQLDEILKEIKNQLGGEPESYSLRFGGMEAKRLSIENDGFSRIAYVVWSGGWVGVVSTKAKLNEAQASLLEEMVLTIAPRESANDLRQPGTYDSPLFSIAIPDGWSGRIQNHTTLELSYQDLSKGVGKFTVYVVSETSYTDSDKWSQDFIRSMGWKAKTAKMPIGNAIFTTFKNSDGNLATRIYCSIRRNKIAVMSYTASTPEIEGEAKGIAKGLVFK
jgi:hypothetical protein